MRTIYTHPKKAFQGISGVSKWEISMFSLIVALLLMATYSQLQTIYKMKSSAGAKINSGLTPMECIALVVLFAVLYLIGVAAARKVVKKRNARMNEEIEAARTAVKDETELEIDHMDMSFLLSYAIRVPPNVTAHNDTVGDIEHTLTFSAVGDNVTISCSSVVNRKTAPAALRLAAGTN